MNTVSIIIPAYNAERTLRDTLTSVLAQTVTGCDIIVVDDGSTDQTAAVAESMPGVTVLRQANAGPAAAVNTGLAAARGTHIGLLDADDLWLPDTLAFHLEHLAQHPQSDVSLGWVSEFICPSMSEQDAATFRPRPDQPAWLAGAALLKREVFDRVGPYNPVAFSHGWIDWVDRARSAGIRFEMGEAVVLKRRLHKGSLSTSGTTRAGHGIISAVRLSIARRRAGEGR